MSHAVIPANRAYTEYQQVLLDSLTYAEKARDLLEKKDWDVRKEAVWHLDRISKLVGRFLQVPNPSNHPGLLSELGYLFGNNNEPFRRTLRIDLTLHFPEEIVNIVIRFVGAKEPAIEDVVDENGNFKVVPRRDSVEVEFKVAVLLENLAKNCYDLSPAKK